MEGAQIEKDDIKKQQRVLKRALREIEELYTESGISNAQKMQQMHDRTRKEVQECLKHRKAAVEAEKEQEEVEAKTESLKKDLEKIRKGKKLMEDLMQQLRDKITAAMYAKEHAIEEERARRDELT